MMVIKNYLKQDSITFNSVYCNSKGVSISFFFGTNSMKLFFIAFLIFSNVYSQEYRVTINVTVKNFPAGAKVYITGNNAQLGFWNPGKTELDSVTENVFSKTFSFPINERVEYKITRGSWSTEAVYDTGNTPSNFVLVISKDTTINIPVEAWKDQFELPVVGQVTGAVDYYRNFESPGILSRDVAVWLPPGYYVRTDKRYPVLYMHDGQNLFDPQTATFGIDWQLDETADSLIKNGFIEDIIIVAIYNTQERRMEYSQTRKGYAYIDFIVNVLKPFIDEKYRTKPDRKNTAVGGSSLGGLISFMMLWEYNDVFSMAACFSPAFKYENFDYVSFVDSTADKKRDFSLYIDNGGVGLEKVLQPGINEMMEVLKKYSYEFEWFLDETAEHNETAWGLRVWRPLVQFFKRK